MIKALATIFITSYLTRVQLTPDLYISVHTPSVEADQYKVCFLMPGLEMNDEYWFGTHEYADSNTINGLEFFDTLEEPIIFVGFGHSYCEEQDLQMAIDYIKSTYPVSEDKKDWAFCGYSSGGQAVFNLAIRHFNEVFGCYGAFSGGLPIPIEDYKVDYLYVCWGSIDVAMHECKSAFAYLQDNDIIDMTNSSTEVIQGVGHNWKTAIDGLSSFIKIFKGV